MSPSAYASWSKDDLIDRIQSLEAVLNSAPKIPPERIPKPVHLPITSQSQPNLTASGKKLKKIPRAFDISAYPKRKIALKFCYSGWEYNGLALQSDPTPLPMVEAVLLKALGQCRLIDPEGGLDGCGWSRCGRTDKGVSAAGQVVALQVRSSSKPIIPKQPPASTGEETSGDTPPKLPTYEEVAPPAVEDMPYVNMLNSVLPRSIRVLAWSPVADDFDARFSCTLRHYKYFFSPGIPPYPFLTSPALLDIEAMRDGAARLVGDHDFRNFCKIDPSKQVDNYTRRILEATLTGVDEHGHPCPDANPPPLYVLDLKGTGFLYHQVRHIMAILFLIGAKLEPPSIVDTLLDATTIDRKPVYEMADGLPLTLWDCGYPEGSLDWRTSDKQMPESSQNIFYDFDLMGSQSHIKHVMTNHFAKAAEAFHRPPPPPEVMFRVPLGGGAFLQSGMSRYVKLLDRPRGEKSEELNERWRTGAGARRKERRDAAEKAPSSGVGDDAIASDSMP